MRIPALLAAFILTTAAPAADLTLYTENTPPYSFEEGGKPAGSSVEIVRDLLRRTGGADTIQIVPWARGYKEAQEKPEVGLFGTGRLPEREQLFQWVGPIAQKRFILFKKKGGAAVVKSVDDAKKVGSIAVYKDSAKEKTLATLGFANLDSAPKDDLGLKKLMAGRVDLWMSTDAEVGPVARQAGIDPTQLEETVTVKSVDLFVAFSKGTAPARVAEWQKAYDAAKADGTIAGILKKHGLAMP